MKPHPSHVFAVLDGDRRCRYCFAESDWPLIESRCADAPRRKAVTSAPVVSCVVVVGRTPRNRPVIDVENALARYAAGESAASIARSFSTTAETVRRALVKAGATRRTRFDAAKSRSGQLTDRARALVPKMRADYEAGTPLVDIARAYRMDYTLARRVFVEAGIVLRTRSQCVRLALAGAKK
jgi:hypothetical protein